MMTASEIVIRQLIAKCAQIEDSLRAAERPDFRLLSAAGLGDVTEPYRLGLRSDLAACQDELVCWQE